ncbi:odorant receptor 13a-like [Vespula maculifrons]|uniref:Odorant receptor 13a-like n=1 Tax=Vespula maculifrons TaxID=7453 RepID=A0ABD2BPN1_VESMC
MLRRDEECQQRIVLGWVTIREPSGFPTELLDFSDKTRTGAFQRSFSTLPSGDITGGIDFYLILGVINRIINTIPYANLLSIQPYDEKCYAFDCIDEFLRTIMIISGYVGTDCLVISTSFQFTRQLAIFKFRMMNALNDIYNSRQGMIVLTSLLVNNYSKQQCNFRYTRRFRKYGHNFKDRFNMLK